MLNPNYSAPESSQEKFQNEYVAIYWIFFRSLEPFRENLEMQQNSNVIFCIQAF